MPHGHPMNDGLSPPPRWGRFFSYEVAPQNLWTLLPLNGCKCLRCGHFISDVLGLNGLR